MLVLVAAAVVPMVDVFVESCLLHRQRRILTYSPLIQADVTNWEYSDDDDTPSTQVHIFMQLTHAIASLKSH